MSGKIDVAIDCWTAWAPGLETRQDWADWAKGEKGPTGSEALPDISFVKPMIRRRLSKLTKMALATAQACDANDQKKRPGEKTLYLFCSQFGEIWRTTNLLVGLSQDEVPSPMAFSQSVHNTSAGLFTIVNGDTSSSMSIAAGSTTLEATFVDAWTALQTGTCDRAIIVYHDEPLESPYPSEEQAHVVPLAAAFALRSSGEGTRFSLEWRATDKMVTRVEASELAAFKVLRLLTQQVTSAIVTTPRLTWEWGRHG